ncbi:MAG: flagellar basal body L-ring protein FlgH [Verrucomicrobia bacterium]|nr:flagellar basal body L-ring protein FlgH [Verrucomicrobiota bacterium]
MKPLVISLLLPALACAGSLWTAPGSREQGFAADIKAAQVGDILTIVVSESAVTSSSQNKSTTSDGNVDAAVSQFLFPASVSKLGTKGGQLPGIKFGGKSDFAGGGQVSNSQSLNARAAVLVTDVLPNGNLVIAGARRLTFSGETQNVILHGLVRPSDIASDNTIQSSNIADARLEFISEGSLSDAQKRGWLSKFYEKLRPF